MLDEEKKAIEKLKEEKKIGIYEVIRTFKKEGIENFVITRKKYIETILNLIEKQQKEIEELKKDNNYQCEERCRLTFELQETEDRLSKIELQLLEEE